MATNKLALIRYRTIDECLRNRRRKWTLEALIDKVSQVLDDKEGITTGISKRTIQADIQTMRSDKLGYNAPIVIRDKKFYTYEDEAYSISNAPVNEADVEKMKEIVGVLKQLNGFSYFEEMSEVIARLENNLYPAGGSRRTCIQFEDNKGLKGLEHMTPLYNAILHKKALLVEYKSFKAVQSQQQIYYPYLLKEYRNRWYLIARAKKGDQLHTLALDRIIGFEELNREAFIDCEEWYFDTYFDNVIGVTKTDRDRVHKVILQISTYHAPYVLTKPLHTTQTLLRQDEKGIIIRIEVIINFELERELLGYGEWLKVLGPRSLASRIQKRLAAAAGQYGPSTPRGDFG